MPRAIGRPFLGKPMVLDNEITPGTSPLEPVLGDSGEARLKNESKEEYEVGWNLNR